MGVVATLVGADGTQLRGLPDPDGGSFDAAGDVDRLLLEGSGFRVLHRVDLYGQTTLDRAEMAELLVDVERLIASGPRPIERRGLGRLRVMAEACRDGLGLQVEFQGD
jgi:hypothetical protein